MKTNLKSSALLILLLSIIFSACKTNLLVLEDILPSAKQRDFNVSFTQTSLTDFSLILKLTYEMSNPYKKDLPIPDHMMGIFINGENLGLVEEHIGVTIPAKSSKEMYYEFILSSELLKSLLGKNNEITFHSSIEIDLTDFTSMLPNYQLAVTEDFDIETSKFKPLINNLIDKKIGKYNYEMEHSTHVKIPTLPTISASTDPIEITLLGEGIDLINPNAIKEALIPFGDLLINGELDGLKDPFIRAIVNSKVTIPAPTLLEWDRTVEIKMENQVINLLKAVPISNVDKKWKDTKALLYSDVNIPATEYFVDNFLDPYVDSNASDKWEDFLEAYDQWKLTVLPDEIPGPQTTGFEIAIPFTFKNNNEFPINIPVFRSSVFITDGRQPFTIYVKPKSVQELPLDQVPNMATINAKATETIYVIFSFNMEDFNQGIYSLFSGTQFEPNLKGIISYDFGYGSMYVGYDLMGMELDYK